MRRRTMLWAIALLAPPSCTRGTQQDEVPVVYGSTSLTFLGMQLGVFKASDVPSGEDWSCDRPEKEYHGSYCYKFGLLWGSKEVSSAHLSFDPRGVLVGTEVRVFEQDFEEFLEALESKYGQKFDCDRPRDACEMGVGAATVTALRKGQKDPPASTFKFELKLPSSKVDPRSL